MDLRAGLRRIVMPSTRWYVRYAPWTTGKTLLLGRLSRAKWAFEVTTRHGIRMRGSTTDLVQSKQTSDTTRCLPPNWRGQPVACSPSRPHPPSASYSSQRRSQPDVGDEDSAHQRRRSRSVMHGDRPSWTGSQRWLDQCRVTGHG